MNRNDGNRNNRNDQAKKKPIPPPPRVGKKKKNKGIDSVSKLPVGNNCITQLLPSQNVG